MKKINWFIVGFCFFNVDHVYAQNNAESLFNGKDLSGWVQYNGKAKYTVENGELVGRTVMNEPNSFYQPKNNMGTLF